MQANYFGKIAEIIARSAFVILLPITLYQLRQIFIIEPQAIQKTALECLSLHESSKNLADKEENIEQILLENQLFETLKMQANKRILDIHITFILAGALSIALGLIIKMILGSFFVIAGGLSILIGCSYWVIPFSNAYINFFGLLIALIFFSALIWYRSRKGTKGYYGNMPDIVAGFAIIILLPATLYHGYYAFIKSPVIMKAIQQPNGNSRVIPKKN